MLQEIKDLPDYAVRRRMLQIASELDGLWPSQTGPLRERLLEITERLEFAVVEMEYSPLPTIDEMVEASIAKSDAARIKWFAGEFSDA